MTNEGLVLNHLIGRTTLPTERVMLNLVLRLPLTCLLWVASYLKVAVPGVLIGMGLMLISLMLTSLEPQSEYSNLVYLFWALANKGSKATQRIRNFIFKFFYNFRFRRSLLWFLNFVLLHNSLGYLYLLEIRNFECSKSYVFSFGGLSINEAFFLCVWWENYKWFEIRE